MIGKSALPPDSRSGRTCSFVWKRPLHSGSDIFRELLPGGLAVAVAASQATTCCCHKREATSYTCQKGLNLGNDPRLRAMHRDVRSGQVWGTVQFPLWIFVLPAATTRTESLTAAAGAFLQRIHRVFASRGRLIGRPLPLPS